jgi:hypothetical protein
VHPLKVGYLMKPSRELDFLKVSFNREENVNFLFDSYEILKNIRVLYFDREERSLCVHVKAHLFSSQSPLISL